MDLLIVVVFVSLAGLAIRWLSAAGRMGDTLLAGLFRAPDFGWPPGVQEDDDHRWSWSGPTEEDEPAPVAVERVRMTPVTRMTIQDARRRGL